MPAALPFSCSIFVLCRRNTICTFSEPQWAFALLAARETIADEVGRRVLQVTSSSKACGLMWNSESSHSSQSNKYGHSQTLGSRNNYWKLDNECCS